MHDSRVDAVATRAPARLDLDPGVSWHQDPLLADDPPLLAVASLVAGLELEFERAGLFERVPGAQRVQYGFIDSMTDDFGILIYASPRIDHATSLDYVVLADEKFPVLVRRWLTVEAARPAIGPYRALATCWARSNKYESGRNEGIVTALHAVFHNNFNDVLLSPSGTGKLLDEGTGGIDAAFIDVSMYEGSNFSARLAIQGTITPGMIVEFTDQLGGIVQATVLTVSRIDAIASGYRQCSFMLSRWGRPGDSGALVTERTSGHGAGIYTGTTMDPLTGATVGECQHLGQVAKVLNLDLFES